MSDIRNRRDLELGIELGLDRIDEAGIDLIEGRRDNAELAPIVPPI